MNLHIPIIEHFYVCNGSVVTAKYIIKRTLTKTEIFMKLDFKRSYTYLITIILFLLTVTACSESESYSGKVVFMAGYKAQANLPFVSAYVAQEQGFFQESLVCVSNEISDTMSKEKLLEQLKQNSISCKDVSFKILGMSLASINTIFSAILSVIFIKLFINYEKNK